MKVQFSSIALAKLKAASAQERRAVKDATQKLGVSQGRMGHRLAGLDNAYQFRASTGGPVLLYEVTPDGVATVKGLITSRQQEVGNVTIKNRSGKAGRGSKKDSSPKGKTSEGNKGRLPQVA